MKQKICIWATVCVIWISRASSQTISGTVVDAATNTPIQNVNVYIDSITTDKVTFRTSTKFTGKVQFHAIRIGTR